MNVRQNGLSYCWTTQQGLMGGGCVIEQLARNSQNAAGRLHVRNALTPILWADAIVIPLLLCGVFFLYESSPIIAYACLGCIILFVTTTCFSYMFFVIKSPEKLQSEDYQLRHESIQWMQQKGGDIQFTPTQLEQVINPALSSLENKGDKQ